MSGDNEKRRTPRIPFDGAAHLHIDGKILPAELMDVSLKGALVSLHDDPEVVSGTPCELVLVMEDSDIRIPAEAVVRRVEDGLAGLEFTRIELDAMQHLRRLVELHQGMPQSLEALWLEK